MAKQQQFAGRFAINETDWKFFKGAVKHFGYNTASEALREKVREINEKEMRRQNEERARVIEVNKEAEKLLCKSRSVV